MTIILFVTYLHLHDIDYIHKHHEAGGRNQTGNRLTNKAVKLVCMVLLNYS